ncbi:glutathione S-transferase family protein [Caulobacter segnis]|uniref:Glutathione S-transferase domain protein n=2 Tax=Caulobacter segnis TaxID=88688 RepID=D5VHK1_CAUST|nr:glutathione S-transferase family protein [Caulobacter segnis]ADG08859.1 Glutathione S-transferase domain protein [Caulobacter segnis ATCC 21756]AVQ00700.1 glutathione S-transferase family protein [Caulobacter segnis]
MQLISLPVSPFAARVRIAIRAKDLDVEIVAPPEGWSTDRRFRGISPTGRLPVLILDDGEAVGESAVILELLEEMFPRKPLLPREPLARAKVRILARHADLYLMPPMSALGGPHEAREGRTVVQQLLDGLEVLEGLLDDEGRELTLADCTLAPVLFAAEVTGQRLGVDLIDSFPNVTAYQRWIGEDPSVAAVLVEMREGLRSLVRKT